VYAVTSQGFAPLPSARRLGDAAFDWGRPGEGVYELAWAMLAAATSALMLWADRLADDVLEVVGPPEPIDRGPGLQRVEAFARDARITLV